MKFTVNECKTRKGRNHPEVFPWIVDKTNQFETTPGTGNWMRADPPYIELTAK